MKKLKLTIIIFSVSSILLSCVGSSGSSSSSEQNSTIVINAIPSAPDSNNFNANAIDHDSISVSWSSVSDATSYKVFRATSENGSKAEIYSDTNTSYTSNGLSASTAYYFWVQACNSAGCSHYSSPNNATTSSAPIMTPIAPATLNASTIDHDSISVSWSSVSDATSYKVFRATSENGSKAEIYSDTNTSYTSNGLSASTAYYFWVQACNSAGCSHYSSPNNATTSSAPIMTPIAPATLNASTIDHDSISVSWSSVSDATSYKVFRATSENGSKAEIYSDTNTSYTSNGLSASTAYYFWVQACNSAGCSDYSSPNNATTSSAPIMTPIAPATLNASTIDHDSISVSWSSVSDATSYKVFRATSENGSKAEIYSDTNTSYTSNGLSASTAYYFWVQACNSAGCSDYSSPNNATTSSAPIMTIQTIRVLSSGSYSDISSVSSHLTQDFNNGLFKIVIEFSAEVNRWTFINNINFYTDDGNIKEGNFNIFRTLSNDSYKAIYHNGSSNTIEFFLENPVTNEHIELGASHCYQLDLSGSMTGVDGRSLNEGYETPWLCHSP